MKFRFLTVRRIAKVHRLLLRRYGGEEGIGHRGSASHGLTAAVMAVKNSYYETVHELAAAYAVYIIQGHVFLDGNKRAGAYAMTAFLKENGIEPVEPALVQRLVLALQQRSERGASTGALVAWLARRI